MCVCVCVCVCVRVCACVGACVRAWVHACIGVLRACMRVLVCMSCTYPPCHFLVSASNMDLSYNL